MDKEQYIVALEIGSSKIVGAIATKSANSSVSVIAVEEESVVDCVRYGVIQNIEEVNTRVGRIISRLEKRSLVAPRKIQAVFVGVQGRSMKNIVSEVSKQFDETTITELHIKELRNECTRQQIEGFEIIGVIPRKYIVDKTPTLKPVGTIGSRIDAQFNLIVAKPQVKGNLRRLMDKQNVRVKKYFTTPLCVAEAVLSTEERRLGCMLVDLGAETTTVSIYKNDVLIYLGTIPIGSRNITRDITALNILEERAEDIKKTIGNANVSPNDKPVTIDDISSADVNNYVSARSGEIVANIMAQLEYAHCTSEEIPAGIILVGGGVKLKGFTDILANQYKGKCREGHIDSVDFTTTKAQGIEYVSVISILNKAARILPVTESCCSHVEDTPATTNDDNTDNDNKKEEKPKKKSGGWGNLFGNVKKRISTIFEEPNEEDDDDDDDNNEDDE